MKKNKYMELFFTFFKIGLFTFGGGYAMIPLIQKEAVERRKWINDEDILEIVAIAESTPGPIAINAATFVGYRTAGNTGALCATLGVVLPSFCIILALSYVLRQFESFQPVQYAFWGIRAGVLALIVKAMVSLYRQCPKNVPAYFIGGLAFICVAAAKISVLPVIIAAAVLGLIFSSLKSGKEALKK